MIEDPETDLERGRRRKRAMNGLRPGSQDIRAGDDGMRVGLGTSVPGEIVSFRLGEGVVGVGSLTTVYS